MAMVGTGTLNDPFLVANTTDMSEVGLAPSKVYKQVAHIDLVSIPSFVKIGSDSTPFSGTFDGNGFEIRNLTIDTNIADLGLFGNFTGKLLNIQIKNGSVKNGASASTGGLVGYFNGGTITNCHYNGLVQSDGSNTGGLIGRATAGIATKCSSGGSVSGNTFVGGFVGHCSTIRVEDSFTTTNVLGASTGSAIGGFVGYSTGASTCWFERCYSTGSVEGKAQTGGFGGHAATYTFIKNCYTLAPFVKKTAGSPANNLFARFLGYQSVNNSATQLENNYALSTMEYREG